jgi:hypothetical protein
MGYPCDDTPTVAIVAVTTGGVEYCYGRVLQGREWKQKRILLQISSNTPLELSLFWLDNTFKFVQKLQS